MLSNNEQNERKSRITALAGTILFHALTVGILVFLAFHTDFPLPPEEGVEVNFEYGTIDTGNLELQKLQQAPIIESRSDQEEADAKMSVEVKPETDTKKKKETVKPASPKSKISIVETPDESTLIHRTPNTGKSKKTSTNEGQGSAGKPDSQVKKDGTNPMPINEGNGANGNGISYDLGGRRARLLPKPLFNSSEDGKIVVSVKVNIEGKVISATAGAKGTTIAQSSLRKQAETAARNSLFTRETNAPEEQRGTITYEIVKQK